MSNVIETAEQLKDKYEKLAQDYTKQRNKLSILKKAYVELNDQATHKDQLMRKYEQEIESLNFRNKQLVTRISLLQEQSEQTSLVSNDKDVLIEEFERKINENAYLHQQINDLEMGLNDKYRNLNDDLEYYKQKNVELELIVKENDLKSVKYEEKLDFLEQKINFMSNISNLNENFQKIFNLLDEKFAIIFDKTDLNRPECDKLLVLCKNFQLNNTKIFFQQFIQSYTVLSEHIFDRELKFYANQVNIDELKRLNLKFLNCLSELSQCENIDLNLKQLVNILNEILMLKHQFNFQQNLLTIDECLVFYLQKHLNVFKFLVEINNNGINEQYFQFGGNTCECKCHTTQESSQESRDQLLPIEQKPEAVESVSDKPVDMDELIQYYKTEVNNLQVNLEFVASKANCFYDELKCVRNLLNINETRLEQFDYEKQNLNANINKLNDELETISNRYEDQLRTMSEHIAQLNDKLIEQNEFIDKLQQQQANNKSSKLSFKKSK